VYAAAALFAAALFVVAARADAPLLGMQAETEPAADSAPPAPSRIDTVAGDDTDRAIERRLRGIFAELDGLGEVRATSRDGVVELSGETLSTDAHERAVRLARQVQGVVEVEDRIAEVHDVGRRLAPVIARLTARGWELVRLAPLLVVALAIVALFGLLGWVVGRWEAPFRRLSGNPFLADVLRHVARAAIVLAGVLIALDVLDAAALVGTVLGAAGVLGLALGFALRDTVENYIASLLLSLRQPFGHDDLVLIEGFEGRVLRLTSRATVLMTLDGNHVRIPNAIVYKSVIVNYTRHPKRRFSFDVGVGTDQDLAAAQQLGTDTLVHMDGVLDEPPPVATVEALGDSSVAVRVTGWVDQRRADFLKVRSEAIRLVKLAFDTAGVTMPEPIFSVRVAAPGGVSETAAPARTPSPSTGPRVAIDIAPGDPLSEQVSAERRGHAADDLLTPTARPE